MDDRWARLKEAFDQLAPLDAGRREPLLKLICNEDSHFESELRRLLRMHDRGEDEAMTAPGHTIELSWRHAGSRHVRPPQRIGPWKILHQLGAGGMSVVYAVDRDDGQFRKRAALKMLRAGVHGDDAAARFSRERQLLADLDHPNIARLLDGGIGEDGSPYLVMDYIDGTDIITYASSKNLPLEQRISLFRQVCSAVQYAHARGVVHRDIKPGNVLVTQGGVVKLIDFGIAKLLETHTGIFEDTATNARRFTLRYASPEQVLGHTTGPGADVYALGLLLYELTTGEQCLSTDGLPQYEAERLICEVPRDFRLAPPALRRVLERATMKDPAARYASAADMLEALESPAERRPRSTPVMVAATVVLLLALALVAAYRRTSTPVTVPVSGAPGKVRAITFEVGVETMPAFSPDGKRLVFIRDRPGSGHQLAELDLESGETELLKADDDPTFPAWSPDGRRLAYWRTHEQGFRLIVTERGGDEKEFAAAPHGDLHQRRPAWSHDGRELLFSVQERAGSPHQIVGVEMETGNRRALTSPPAGILGDIQVACARDVCVVVRNSEPSRGDLYVVPRHGEARRLTSDELYIAGLAVTPDGREAIYSADRDGTGLRLWRIRVTGGEPVPALGYEAVHGGGGGASWPAIVEGPQGWRLAYLHETRDVNVWLESIEDQERKPILTEISSAAETNPSLSPDGTWLAVRSVKSGTPQIWVAVPDGSHARQLTRFSAPVSSPAWSPDGKRIAFVGTKNERGIWVTDMDGHKFERISSDGSDAEPSWSADGRSIYFRSKRSGTNQIWKETWPVPSGARKITTGGAWQGVESTGDRLYFVKERNQPGVWSVPVEGGEEQKISEMGEEGLLAASRLGVYYFESPWWFRDDIPGKPLRFISTPGLRRRVAAWARLRSNLWRGVSVSRDGRWLAYTQTDASRGDLMLVDGFR